MAETDLHRRLMIDLLHALEEYFLTDKQVYVSGNIFVYYRDENGEMLSVSPDIFVVHGVQKRNRRIYKVEDEGRVPEVVIELTSSSTKVEDFFTKNHIYAYLGVREYFLFDPFPKRRRLALQGFRLEQGKYVPLAEIKKNGAVVLLSEVLGLELRAEQGYLRLYDPATGKRLRTPDEAEAGLYAADRRAKAAVRRMVSAEKRVISAEQRVQEEAQARQEAETKAAAAEAETARLRKELSKLRSLKKKNGK